MLCAALEAQSLGYADRTVRAVRRDQVWRDWECNLPQKASAFYANF